MLCLDRKVGETITIETPAGEVIKITVGRLSLDQVKLNFDAKKDIKIHRDDIIRKKKRRSYSPPSGDLAPS